MDGRRKADGEVLVERAATRFADRCGRSATFASWAPGRVNLIGEHTDYNDGFVLPVAIDSGTAVAGAARDDGRIVVVSADQRDAVELGADLRSRGALPAWGPYVRGVLVEARRIGVEFGGFDAFVASDLPLGGGLSSSAALVVSLFAALEAFGGVALDPLRRALACRTVEHEAVGVPCGIMDQLASCRGLRGRALFIDCRSLSVEAVEFDEEAVALVVVDSGVRHELADGRFAERRRTCSEAARSLGVRSLRDWSDGGDGAVAGGGARRGAVSPERREGSNRISTLDAVARRRVRHVVPGSRNRDNLCAHGCHLDLLGRGR